MPAYYEYGDDGYDDLHTKWVSDGRPTGQFEQLGEFGGRRWAVIPIDGQREYPTFSLLAASSGTPTGYDSGEAEWTKPDEWRPRSGYELDQIDAGIEFREGPGGPGDLRITYEKPERDTTV